MDGFAPLAPAMKALAGSSGSRMSSEEHERLERLRRCASCVSFESADGSDEGTEEWAFTPGPAAKARLIESKAGGVWALARRADGTVFFGTQAGEVRAWAPGTEGTAGVLLGQHGDGVYAVSLSGDGKTLFSASQENIKVWNVSGAASELKEAQFVEIAGHSESVYALASSPDGRTLFSAGEDCTIRVWRVEQPASGPVSATCVDVLDEHLAPITALAVSPQGVLFSAGEDRTVRAWRPLPAADGLGFACAAVFEGHTAAVTSLLAAGDGRTLFSGSWDQSVRVWDYWTEAAPAVGAAESDSSQSQPQMRHSLTAVLSTAGSEGAVLCLALSPDGATLFTGGSDKAVNVWALPEAVAAARSAAAAAAAGEASAPAADDAPAEAAAAELAHPSSPSSSSMTDSPLPRISESSAAGPEDDLSAPSDAATASPAAGCCPGYLVRLDGHRRAVTSLLVLPDGCSLISGSVDRTVREWRVALPKAWAPTAAAHSQFPLGFRQGVQALLMAVSADTQAPVGALGRLDWATRAGLAARIAEALAASSYGAQ